MIISNNGTIIRMHVSDISKIGRNTQGVRVMRLKGSTVATVAIAPREEEETETEEAEPVSGEEVSEEGGPIVAEEGGAPSDDSETAE